MAVTFTSKRGNFELTWRADDLDAEKAETLRVVIDEVNAFAAADARANHPPYPPASEPGERYHTRTGGTTASIFESFAEVEDDGTWVWGEWGVLDVKPALFLEFGTRSMAPRPFLYPAWDKSKDLFWVRYNVLRGTVGIPRTSIAHGKVGRGWKGRYASLSRFGVNIRAGT